MTQLGVPRSGFWASKSLQSYCGSHEWSLDKHKAFLGLGSGWCIPQGKPSNCRSLLTSPNQSRVLSSSHSMWITSCRSFPYSGRLSAARSSALGILSWIIFQCAFSSRLSPKMHMQRAGTTIRTKVSVQQWEDFESAPGLAWCQVAVQFLCLRDSFSHGLLLEAVDLRQRVQVGLALFVEHHWSFLLFALRFYLTRR